MSAWIVSKAHIDVLVHALGVREMFPEGMDPDAVGTMLWQECHDSVNYRYSESTPTPPYVYTAPPAEWTPGDLLHQIACYHYQSCEHPGWDTSTAKALTTALEQVLERAGATRESKGNDTPWGVPVCGGNHGYIDCQPCKAIYDAAEARSA
jgi:hypothetical protein